MSDERGPRLGYGEEAGLSPVRPGSQSERVDRVLERARRSRFWALRIGAVDASRFDEVPPVSKSELLEDQLANPPYGSRHCVDETQIARIFSTSGTSGVPLLRVMTARDWQSAVERVATNFRGLDRVGPVLVTSPADHFGPAMTMEAIAASGLAPVGAGRWTTQMRAQYIASASPVALAGVPSYLLHLGDIGRQLGLRFEDAGIERILAFGEGGGSQRGMKSRLSESYGGAEVLDGYGMSETGPLGRACPDGHGLHLYHPELLVESLDPATGAPVPDGELGELVITTLEVEAQPLIRYRTGDLVRLARWARCSCGSDGRRTIGPLQGRADDMIVFRGVNIFPAIVAELVAGEESLAGAFEIVVDERDVLATIVLRVEPSAGVSTVAALNAKRRLASRLQDVLGINLETQLEEPGSVDVELPSGKHRNVRRIR